ncbi:LytR/AlgR family response regulator transcription factor [Sphingobacterium siyangense]|uniref:LytTR family two component transcriptional regulator n=1 Tax=Sphingobacterium siyangense TaxID=459529 RepID=A0A562M707_9SPHI|nr:LytTR family DNA-binding domain-containing protein [Sphingobacterium siyangense]TWI15660.1 LytTR family two component transcriptional regulator [Sphingobacterium siyangense]
METIKRLLRQEKRVRKIRVGILDDDPEMVEELKEYVDLTVNFECVFSSTNPKEALMALRTLKLDVLFLDIEMPVISGLDILPQLEDLKLSNPGIANMQVVVCSTNGNVGDKMFLYGVADYFLKPFEMDRYWRAIKNVKTKLMGLGLNDLDEKNNCFFYGRRGKERQRLDYGDIICIEAKNEQSWIWLDGKTFIEVNESFGDILTRLPKSKFAQIHRSFAVSLNHVTGITAKHVYLSEIELNRGEKGKYKYFDKWIEDNVITGNLNTSGEVRLKARDDHESNLEIV